MMLHLSCTFKLAAPLDHCMQAKYVGLAYLATSLVCVIRSDQMIRYLVQISGPGRYSDRSLFPQVDVPTGR